MDGYSGRSTNTTLRSATPRIAKYVPVRLDPWLTRPVTSDQQFRRDKVASESARQREDNQEKRKEKTHTMHVDRRQHATDLRNQGNNPTNNGVRLLREFENREAEMLFQANSKASAKAYAEAQRNAFYSDLDENQKKRENLPFGGYMNIAKRRLLVGIINSKKKNSGKKTKVVKRKVKAVKAVSVLKPVRRQKPKIVRK
jgi:hypothetical protein